MRNSSDDYDEPLLQDTDESENEERLLGINTVTVVPSSRSLSSAGKRLKPTSSSVVSFHNINYEVEVRKSLFSGKKRKQILKDISGIFKPGMNGILGPTGSGKSSLLDILAGRKDPNGLSGNVLLDGLPPPENFKCLVGYVVQDDVVMGTLTVRENLEFSASLRLPPSISTQKKKRRVDQVINELGLSKVADSKVGTEFIRGVSGGERKRCNIGMELIISPPVLFLDEPTTGLDASTANAVMLQLKRLANSGRNIIFSIHQPRYSIFRLFDSLMLLSHGEVVYHGPKDSCIDYFTSIGFQCEEHNNPPDFFLDVINGDSAAAVLAHEDSGMVNDQHAATIKGFHDDIIEVDDRTESLVAEFKGSQHYRKLQMELNPIKASLEQSIANGTLEIPTAVQYQTNFFTQLVTLSARCSKNLVRNPAVTILSTCISTFTALVVGGIYFQMSSNLDTGIQNRVGAFFFIIMNQIFGNMSAVELFIRERTIFIHENISGFYRVSAYFLAKVFCDVIPMRIFPAVIFSSVTYWMMGLRPDVYAFLFFMLTLFLTALSASTLSFAISATVRIYAMATLCLSLSYVFMMLFSGFLINIGDLGEWIMWIKYLSIFRYSLNALSVNELENHLFCNHSICVSGNVYLEQQNINFGSQWDKWVNILAMGAIGVGFLCLGYIQLRRMKKLK